MSIELRLSGPPAKSAPGSKKPSGSRKDLEFLPAALEVLEKPPSPTARVLAFALCTFAVIAVAWATFGEVDIVAVAQGKIVPTGQVKVIQPLEPGVIRAIHVQEGERVQAGQALIELDPTETTADRERLTTDLLAARTRSSRLEALLRFLENGDTRFLPPANADPVLVEPHRRMFESQIEEYRTKLSANETEGERLNAALRSVEAEIGRVRKILPLVREEAQVYRDLSERKMASRSDFLNALERQVSFEQDLVVQRSKREEVQTELASLIEQRQLIEAEFRREILGELTETKERIESLSRELTKATQRSARQKLVAPVDGAVQRLAVHTIGGVVTTAQELMVLVPQGQDLEIEAWVNNKDVAFVAEGQPAEIKVETLPFTRYGLVDGRIKHISTDALPPKEGEENAGSPVYLAKVSLDRDAVRVGDRDVLLAPGMAVSVEIKTGTRKLIEFIMSPLLRYQHEAVRER
ncbi:MAG: HlyD family type I secretion periplasmic adaptor subunit [Kiloniellales bacterium]|nr:HlyD family type I secretion periplasmic adaptor subunit [Kiloniellales bacterium]